MPTFDFTSPDGKSYSVEGPAGATKEQAFAILQQRIGKPDANLGQLSGKSTTVGAPATRNAPAPAQPAAKADGTLGGARREFESMPAPLRFARNAVGAVVEPAMAMGSGMVAYPMAKIAGLGATLGGATGLTDRYDPAIAKKTGKGSPEQFADEMQRALTYEPVTPAGKAVTEHNPLALLGKLIGKIGGGAGNLTEKAIPGPVGSALGSGVREGIEQAPAFLAGPLSSRVPKIASPPLSQAERAVADVRGQGWVLPPTQVNPSMLNRIVEGWGGKWSTEQEASIKNQTKVQALARRAIGLKEGAPISPDTLDVVRDNAGQAYTAVKRYDKPIEFDEAYTAKIGDLTGDYSKAAKRFPDVFKGDRVTELQKAMLSDPRKAASIGVVDTINQAIGEQPGVRFLPGLEAKELMPAGVEAPKGPPKGPPSMTTTEAIEVVKQLRKKATDNLKDANFGDAEKRSLGFAQKRAADAIDDLMERQLENAGERGLVKDYRAARTRIAQTYDIESALNSVTGTIDARKLGTLLDKRPLSAQLKDIAEFAKTAPRAAQPPERFGGHPGINPWDLMMASVHGITGNPSALARGLGMAAGRPLAAKMGTSDWYQNRFVQPRGTVPPANVPPWLMAMIQAESEGRK